jgi:SAM-dependent methyltransferase
MHLAARLNPARDFRDRLVLDHLRRLLPADGSRPRLLDIGCGTGDFVRLFRNTFPHAECVGVDGSSVGVEICRRRVPGAVFIHEDLMLGGPPDRKYQGWATAAVCSEVLEHADEPERILENVKTYLAEGAPLIITVPGGPMSAFDRHIGHRQHFSNRCLAALLERSGYRVEGVWGAGFPFFNLYRLTVIGRSKRLVADVSRPDGTLSLPARLVMALFRALFRFNSYRSKLGWQRVAVATLATPPGPPSAPERRPPGAPELRPPGAPTQSAPGSPCTD